MAESRGCAGDPNDRADGCGFHRDGCGYGAGRLALRRFGGAACGYFVAADERGGTA